MSNLKLDYARAVGKGLDDMPDGELAAVIYEEHHTDEPVEEFAPVSYTQLTLPTTPYV